MRRRKSTIFFLVFGICLTILAVALNVGWIFFSLQQIVLLVFGIIFFALIITGLVLNTTFLVREIRRNEKQDAFLNAMTHELKTPIASIKLYLETLQTREVDDKKRKEFHNIMLADCDRLLTTVEQVLAASKTRETSRKLNLSKIEVGALITECVDLVRSRYNLENEVIKFSPPNEDIFVSGDLTELRTVFSNLLDNAVKYSKEIIDVSIKMRERQKSIIEIRIKDQGVGISQGELKTVFRRFYRVESDATQTTKGTGLGLYIVRSVIKKHGGKTFAKSKGEGKGSIFIVQLPKLN